MTDAKQSILAIDPGAGGGLAIQPPFGPVECQPMPEGMTAQIDVLRSISAQFPMLRAVVERVGFHRPGNSATATAKFARHVGHLEAALYAMGIPFTEVTPQKWMADTGPLPTDKQARKRAIREEMARRYPYLKVTLGVADALGILEWARKQSN